MKPHNQLVVALTLVAGATLHEAARADLIHRYRFNETAGTVVTDAVGSAHGELKGNGGFFGGDGKLYLPGGTSSAATPDVIAGYVDLPNHIINVLEKITIETWVTWEATGSDWQRIFDFGTSQGGEDISDGNGNYLFMSPEGPDVLRFAVRDPVTGAEPTQLNAGGPLPPAEPVCITVTYDPTQNVSRMYSNAVLVVTGPAGIALKDINDVNNWLGRSQWGDPMFYGEYDEFRIYDSALDSVQVAASFVSGAEAPSTDPAKLGSLLSVDLAVVKTTMTEADTQTAVPTADFANLAGISLIGVAGATMTSDNETVATISAAGVISALKPGVANITLSYLGQSDVVPLAVNARQTGIAVAGALAVDLRATDAAADPNVWPNRATPGTDDDFYALGTPTYAANVAGTGVAGVQFNDTTPAEDSYVGPLTTAELHGGSDRSIEVWAYNPSIADEETLVGMGRRGGPDGTNLSFNYGANGTYGAVGHWGAPDMGWAGTPVAGRWHYLVYTYDGVNTAKVYADGLPKYTETFGGPLNTHPDNYIRIGAQTLADMSGPENGLLFSGYLAMVRVHTGKLSDADVANNFLYGPTLNPPGELQSVTLQITRPTIYGARDIGQATVVADYANLKNVDVTGFSTLASSDTGVLTVAAAGRYTAVKEGTATLTGTYQGRPATASVTVAPPPGLALKHRYSFSEAPGTTTVEDSKGDADGVVKGTGADFDGAGKLSLPGGTGSAAGETISGYVDLPNGIISPLVNVSFETWVTWDATASAWQRIFDFGTSAGGEDNSNGNGAYLFLSPQGDANLRFAVRDPVTGAEPTQITAGGPLPQGQEVYLAATYDFTGNVAVLYSNAVQVATATATVPLIAINDVNNWLGRSQWNDSMFQGTYNEFRIWQGALAADQVAANFAAGPNTVPEPVQPPQLGIALAKPNVILSWPASATGFALQSSTSVGSTAAWGAVDTSSAVTEGGMKKLTLPVTSANQFFRMVK